MNAQSSLEYLLLLAALFSFLLVIVPGVNEAMNAVSFLVDTGNAVSFVSGLVSVAEEMRVLSDGSIREVTARPLGEWRVSVSHGILSVRVFSGSLEKNIEREIPSFSDFDVSFSGKKVFSVGKEGGNVLVEHD